MSYQHLLVNAPEGLPVLGRHDVVDDGVDGGVDVEEHARDVEQLLVDGVVHLIRDPVQSKNRRDS